MASVVDLIQGEIRRLGGRALTISSNVPLRSDGLPRGDYARSTIGDKGVAVYFKLNGQDLVFACDKWNKIEHNMYAIAKHIEAMRGQGRWGVGTQEQQFRGYAALPDAGGTSGIVWWEVLGLSVNAPLADIKTRYRNIAKSLHPDSSEDTPARREAWIELQEAYRLALMARGEQ